MSQQNCTGMQLICVGWDGRRIYGFAKGGPMMIIPAPEFHLRDEGNRSTPRALAA